MAYFQKPRLALTEQHMSRRRFLRLGALTTTVGLCPRLAVAYSRRAGSPEKSLAIYNAHTGEKLKRTYWFRGKYLPDALRDINRILRDHHSDEIRPIDPDLLDLLHSLGQQIGADEPFHVISGYRSPVTNAILRQYNRRVAEHSLHIEGKAVDIKIPRHSLAAAWRAAVALRSGGVGYYPYANFIHVDTGPVRYW
jgi:uncharacterized protein YcbK (DUF882 family)